MQKPTSHNFPAWRACTAVILTVIILGHATHGAEQTIFFLQNGDRISGVILQESNDTITIQSTVAGKITLPSSQVQRRESAPAPVVAAPTVAATPPAEKAAPQAPPAPVVQAKVVTPPPVAKAKGPKLWNTDIQLGMNLRYGTTHSQEYLATARSTYGKDKLRETLDYQFIYGKAGGIISANRMTGSSKTDYDLNKKVYIYNLASAGYDQVQKIDQQYEIGPGMGFETVNHPKSHFILKTELGFSFLEQFRSDGTDKTTYSARIAEVFTWQMWDKLTAEGRVEFYPNLQDVGNYRVAMEGTLRYPLLKNLSLNLVVIDLYDTEPALGVTKNDMQIRSALGIKF